MLFNKALLAGSLIAVAAGKMPSRLVKRVGVTDIIGTIQAFEEFTADIDANVQALNGDNAGEVIPLINEDYQEMAFVGYMATNNLTEEPAGDLDGVPSARIIETFKAFSRHHHHAVMDLEDKSAVILGSPFAEEFVVSFNQTMQVMGGYGEVLVPQLDPLRQIGAGEDFENLYIFMGDFLAAATEA